MSENVQAQKSPYRWVVLSVMFFTTFVGCYAQYQIPPLAYKLIPELNLTPTQYASILTAPMIPPIFLSIFAGSMADKFGVKKVVAFSLVFVIIGTMFRYMATNYWQMLILMMMAGLSCAFLNANVSKLLGAWFPPEEISKAMGIYLVGATAAMFVGTATTALFPTMKSAFITAGIFAVINAFLWLILIKDKPEGAPDMPSMPVTEYLGVAAKSKNVWLVAVIMMFSMGAMIAFSGFLPNALHEVRGIDPVQAGLLASIGTLGGLFGSLLGPIICDRIGYMKPFLVSVAVVGAALTYYAWQSPLGVIMWVLFLLQGFAGAAGGPLYMSFPALLPEIGPMYAGSAGGIIGTLQVVGAVCIPTFIITPIAGQNYYLLFALGALCFLCVAVVALFLPELGPKAMAKARGVEQSTAAV